MNIRKWKIRFAALAVVGLLAASVPMIALAEGGKDEQTASSSNIPKEVEEYEAAEEETEIASGSDIVKAEEITKEELAGTWSADDITLLEFEANGSGRLILPEEEYAFTYTLKDDQLKLDFASSRASDGTYTVSLMFDTLELNGGRGTIGAAFTLQRVE